MESNESGLELSQQCGSLCLSLLGTWSNACEYRMASVSSLNLTIIAVPTFLLDRDPSGWKFDEAASYRRRLMFWEIYFMDIWNVSFIFYEASSQHDP